MRSTNILNKANGENKKCNQRRVKSFHLWLIFWCTYLQTREFMFLSQRSIYFFAPSVYPTLLSFFSKQYYFWMVIFIPFSTLSKAEVQSLARKNLLSEKPEWEKAIWSFLILWLDDSIEEIIVETSGSTGAPKTIRHAKRRTIASAKMTAETLKLQQGQTALLCLPVDKIGGMMMLIRAVELKLDIICVKPSAQPLIEMLESRPITFAAFTPMQVYNILQNSASKQLFQYIKKVIIGGAEVDSSVKNVLSNFNNHVYQTFGMTETVSHIAFKALTGLLRNTNYVTLTGVRVSCNQYGQLIIDAADLEISHLVTNDIVNIVSDNEFEWLGRADNVINTGGIKVFPEKIEQENFSEFNFRFFITSISDEKLGQKVVLAVEKESLSENEFDVIFNQCSAIEKYKRPKSIILFREFVYAGNGKLQRKNTMLLPYKEIPIKYI